MPLSSHTNYWYSGLVRKGRYRRLFKRAEVDIEKMKSRTPLHLANKEGRHSTARVLIAAVADAQGFYRACGLHPCHLSALRDQPDIAAVLLEAGSYVDIRDRKGSITLHQVAEVSTCNVLLMLLQHGSDVKACNIFSEYPFNSACERGHIDAADLLLIHVSPQTFRCSRLL